MYSRIATRELAREQGAWANIPPKRNRKPNLLLPVSVVAIVIVMLTVWMIGSFWQPLCKRGQGPQNPLRDLTINHLESSTAKAKSNHLAFVKLASPNSCVLMNPRLALVVYRRH
jgi:hypothetical protein